MLQIYLKVESTITKLAEKMTKKRKLLKNESKLSPLDSDANFPNNLFLGPRFPYRGISVWKIVKSSVHTAKSAEEI